MAESFNPIKEEEGGGVGKGKLQQQQQKKVNTKKTINELMSHIKKFTKR